MSLSSVSVIETRSACGARPSDPTLLATEQVCPRAHGAVHPGVLSVAAAARHGREAGTWNSRGAACVACWRRLGSP